jgi:DNA-entry nuclease
MKILFKRLLAFAAMLALILSLLCGCKQKQIINLDEIPEFSGIPYVVINGNEPFFEDDEITDKAFESYSELDALGRCGVAFACIGLEIMPTEDRGEIGSVTPSGWEYKGVSNNRKYDGIDGDYLYNRCHLIGYQLAGENANDKNLITGTRYLNIEGMLPFENDIAEYIEDTDNHVMYRVTPIYNGFDLVASGVLMEAYSVEDKGRGISFCIYAYNVQPGVTIDYYTGQNHKDGESFPSSDEENLEDSDQGTVNYVLNTNSKKFHYPDKSCSNTIKEENRKEYSGTRDELISDGYTPCGTCKP